MGTGGQRSTKVGTGTSGIVIVVIRGSPGYCIHSICSKSIVIVVIVVTQEYCIVFEVRVYFCSTYR